MYESQHVRQMEAWMHFVLSVDIRKVQYIILWCFDVGTSLILRIKPKALGFNTGEIL